MTPEIDPNWEYRIYGDDRASVWAVVDEVDYQWAIQWRWNPKRFRGKVYLRRAVNKYAEGVRIGAATLYLHIEIMRRSGVIPLSDQHVLVDHRNGDSLDCRRHNLRWATSSINRINRGGSHAHDLAL